MEDRVHPGLALPTTLAPDAPPPGPAGLAARVEGVGAKLREARVLPQVGAQAAAAPGSESAAR